MKDTNNRLITIKNSGLSAVTNIVRITNKLLGSQIASTIKITFDYDITFGTLKEIDFSTSMLAILTLDNSVILWDITSKVIIKRYNAKFPKANGESNAINHIAFFENGTKLIICIKKFVDFRTVWDMNDPGETTYSFYFYDIEAGGLLIDKKQKKEHQFGFNYRYYNYDNDILVNSFVDDRSNLFIHFTDLNTSEHLFEQIDVPDTRYLNDVRINLKKKLVAFHSNLGLTIKYLNAISYETNQFNSYSEQNIMIDSTVEKFKFSKDGKYLICGCDNKIQIYNLEKKIVSNEIKFIAKSNQLQFDCMAANLIAVSFPNIAYTISLYNIESGDLVEVVSENEKNISQLSFTKDEKKLISVDIEGLIKIWNVNI